MTKKKKSPIKITITIINIEITIETIQYIFKAANNLHNKKFNNTTQKPIQSLLSKITTDNHNSNHVDSKNKDNNKLHAQYVCATYNKDQNSHVSINSVSNA